MESTLDFLIASSTKKIRLINSLSRSFVAYPNKNWPLKSLLIPGFTANKRIIQDLRRDILSSCLSLYGKCPEAMNLHSLNGGK